MKFTISKESLQQAIQQVQHVVIAGSNVQNLASHINEVGLTDKVRVMSNLPFEFDDCGIPIIPAPAIAELLTASDIYAACLKRWI